ncbi:MAG: DNA repair exonuclease [Clostridia bacterium]|nr:DNA repair exonuclease [Clostridia bacterium]
MRFVHCGDLHLDTAFSGLCDGKTAAIRQAELRRTFLSIIELAKKADVLLIAGDLFDQESLEAETVHTLCRGFADLGDIPVLISAGNHDPLTAGSYYRLSAFPENVHVFDTSLEKIRVKDCDVYGISFGETVCDEALLKDCTFAGDVPSILLMHGDLGGTAYNPIRKDWVSASGLSYLALGHVHSYGEVRLGKTLCAYPGCPEGRGFDELDEKGVILGEVTKDGVKTEFVPVSLRRYREIHLDISGLLTHNAVIEKLSGMHLAPEDLYKVILEGETDLVPDTTVLAEAFPGLFFVKFYDKTSRPLSMDIADSAIRSLFAQKLSERASGEPIDLYDKALQLGLLALSGEKVKPL